ncbi:MAG: glycosyltransferase family 39 protein [Thermoguttaceae bacterium]|nr:glycosyltransferase family 39 protein [Thermoguttaceae bacterium]MDW8078109.1 glycosyltransferase family 39 protein [Thermoguttaceae bacterium]
MHGKLTYLAEKALLILVDILLVSAIIWIVYVARLPELPVCGEEPRRAEVAREMIQTGDYIVPRQQGQIYTSRPPLQNWLIAFMAHLRGSWDAWTIRLPSVIATAGLAAATYFYALIQLGRAAGVSAAIAFATMGQVMQIGGLGETDPIFTFLLGSSLLLWHGLVNTNYAPLAGSILAGTLAGLAGLAKGAQGPVWFLAVIIAWTIIDWWGKRPVGRQLSGIVLSALLCGLTIAAWTIPYARATSPEHAWQIWFGQIESRMDLGGSYRHLFLRPIETLVCWLPWTPLLLAYTRGEFWRRLDPAQRRIALAWIVALAVTFPMVWFVPEARNRYFLPLYPAGGVLLGLLVQNIVREELPWLRRLWGRFVEAIGLVAVVVSFGGLGLLLVEQWVPFSVGWDVRTVLGFVAAVAGFWMLIEILEHYPDSESGSPATNRAEAKLVITTGAVGLIVGLTYTNFIHGSRVAAAQDPSGQIAAIRNTLPEPEKLVSFGPVFHRFRYYYGLPIRLLRLPRSHDEIPPEVTHFCLEGVLMRRAGRDMPAGKVAGHSAKPGSVASILTHAEAVGGGSTSNVLVLETPDGGRLEAPAIPCEWELVAVVPCGRNRNERVQPAVIVGRVIREAPFVTRSLANAPTDTPIRE